MSYLNQTTTAHADTRKIALRGKVGDKLWIKGGKMLFWEQEIQPY
jgi:hypothetical protein